MTEPTDQVREQILSQKGRKAVFREKMLYMVPVTIGDISFGPDGFEVSLTSVDGLRLRWSPSNFMPRPGFTQKFLWLSCVIKSWKWSFYLGDERHVLLSEQACDEVVAEAKAREGQTTTAIFLAATRVCENHELLLDPEIRGPFEPRNRIHNLLRTLITTRTPPAIKPVTAENVPGPPVNLHDSPTNFYFGLQGFTPLGPEAFLWQRGRLTYVQTDRTIHFSKWVKEMDVSAFQWWELWKLCDEVDVWSWPAAYGDRYLRDGTQYTLELKLGSRSVNSWGQIYDDEGELAARVLRFHSGLQALVGWTPPPPRKKKARP